MFGRKQPADPGMGPLPAVSGCDCQICRPDPAYDAADRNAIDTVLRHGWQVTLVSSSHACEHPDHHEDDDLHEHDGPDFAYTVGLGHRAGHPEFLMAGLDPSVMHRALNEVAGRVLTGHRFRAGDVVENVLGRVPVVLEQVSDQALGETVTWSGWFHRREPEALMIVWPTTSGIFAWQPGAPPVLDELQPPAWRVPFVHTGGVAADPPWPFPVPPDRLAFSCTHVVDEGAPVLWVARQTDSSRGEDWSLHCGEEGHPAEDIRLLHLAHLVRAAPSVRELSDLGLNEEAGRADPDETWVRRALPPSS